jgi:glycosyltransferase involved in cell wall biosynthesis
MNSSTNTTPSGAAPRVRVFMMDLWATVPYYTAYLSRALLAEGVDVQVGSITYYLDPGCFRSRRLRPDPGLIDFVGHYHLPRIFRRILKLGEGFLNLTALSVRFFRKPPDIVHVQYLPMLRSRLPVDAWFVFYCQRRGSKIVLTVHDLLPHDTAERYKNIFTRLYHRVDALICHSEHIKTRLETEFGIAPDKIAVIPHGPFFYDLPETDPAATLRRLGVEPGRPFALWQGIIFPYKGLDLLLAAWQQVEHQTDDLDLVVLGTGAHEITAILKEQAQLLRLERVRFNLRFASVEELTAAYRAAQMVIYPYRAITTSGALATGLALGKPIIATDLPVFREMLTDGENAILVQPGSVDHLTAAILRLSSDPQLRDRLAAAVRSQDSGSQAWASIAQRTAVFYAAVLAKPRTLD